MLSEAYHNMSEEFFQMMSQCYLEFNCILNDCMKHSARLLETGRFSAMCLTPLSLASETGKPFVNCGPLSETSSSRNPYYWNKQSLPKSSSL